MTYSKGQHQCYAEGENKSIFGVTNQLSSPWLQAVFHNFPESQMIQNDLGNNLDQISFFYTWRNKNLERWIVWHHSLLITHYYRTYVPTLLRKNVTSLPQKKTLSSLWVLSIVNNRKLFWQLKSSHVFTWVGKTFS